MNIFWKYYVTTDRGSITFTIMSAFIKKKEEVTAECNTVRIIAINLHTNWLMPIGDRECNLNIQHNSIRLLLEVLSDSNLGVHHSNTENCICFWLCPSLEK